APITAIIAYDLLFFEKPPKLFPHSAGMRNLFAQNPQLVEDTAKRNSSLQGAYLIIAARALGLDCGPMSGFDNAKVDEEFFGAGKECEGCEQEFFPAGRSAPLAGHTKQFLAFSSPISAIACSMCSGYPALCTVI